MTAFPQIEISVPEGKIRITCVREQNLGGLLWSLPYIIKGSKQFLGVETTISTIAKRENVDGACKLLGELQGFSFLESPPMFG